MNRIESEAFVFGGIMLLANKLQIWGDGIVEGMTMKQLFLLIVMEKMENKNPTITEVAEVSGTSRQNVKKMLIQLEEKGFVNMGKSEADARAFNVSLSEKAYAYFAENDEKFNAILRGLFSEIPDDALRLTQKTLTILFASLNQPDKGEQLKGLRL